MEEASEQPNSECVMVHDDMDPTTMVIHTVNLFTQTLVIERNVLTLNNIRTDMSKDGDDEEQSIGGADESLSMKNPDRRMHWLSQRAQSRLLEQKVIIDVRKQILS